MGLSELGDPARQELWIRKADEHNIRHQAFPLNRPDALSDDAAYEAHVAETVETVRGALSYLGLRGITMMVVPEGTLSDEAVQGALRDAAERAHDEQGFNAVTLAPAPAPAVPAE